MLSKLRKAQSPSEFARAKNKKWVRKNGIYLKKIHYALCTMQSRFFYVNDTRAGTAVHGKNWERAMHGYITYTHVILYTICLYLSIYFLKFLYILFIYIYNISLLVYILMCPKYPEKVPKSRLAERSLSLHKIKSR